MQTEIEVKFLDVDHDVVRAKLKKIGATLERPMRLMRRVILDHPDGKLEKTVDAFVRVRDEGHQTVMTYKQFAQELAIDSAKEIEIVVDNFEKAVALLVAAGLEVKSEQESKRENWQLGECEIVLDEWPWLKPYIEIEGPTQVHVRDIAEQLGFDWNQKVTGSVTAAYRAEYDIPRQVSVGTNPRIVFGGQMPEWFEKHKRAV